MRANGVRSIAVSCWQCHHEAVLSADRWPDHMAVPTFGPRMVCMVSASLQGVPADRHHGFGVGSVRGAGGRGAATAATMMGWQDENPSRTGRNGWGPVTGPFRRGSVTEVPPQEFTTILIQGI
jgi:hypothetical protein